MPTSSNTDLDLDTTIELKKEIKEPSMYNAFILNDDYTPMDFVVSILLSVFNKDMNEAMHIMVEAHKSDSALVDVYTNEIANEKKIRAERFAQAEGYPLLFKVEKVPENKPPFTP